MALNTLTLAVVQGVQGRRFRSKINGLTAGTEVTVDTDATPGFGVVNGRLSHHSLPYTVNTVAIRERVAATGETKVTRIEIAAASKSELDAQAAAQITAPRTLRGYRTAATDDGNGSLTWAIYAENDLGETAVTLVQGGGTGFRRETSMSMKAWGDVGTGGTSDKTFHITIRCPVPFTRLRVHVDAITALTGLKVAAAVSATDAVQYQPSAGNAFADLTFAGGTTIPASTVGTSLSRVPNTGSSDWLNVASIPRTDGGSGYLVMLRGYQDASSTGAVSFVSPSANITDVDEIGYWFGLSAAASGNQTLSPSQVFNPSNATFPMRLEIDTGAGNEWITFGFIGDSIAQGYSVNARRITPAAFLAAMDLQAAGKLILPANYASQGATTAGGTGQPPAIVSGYTGQFQAWLSSLACKPSILAYTPASPNNAEFTSVAGINDATYWANWFCDFCEEHDIVPILGTPCPRGTQAAPALSAGAEANRKASVAAILNVATARGALSADQSLALTHPTNPQGGFADDTWTSDGTHIATPGSVIIKPVWNAAILAAYNRIAG